MSFQSLRVAELKQVVDFFVKDVEVANEDKGPTKKELLAALASDDGQGPVTWEEYEETYLPAKQAEEAQKSEDVEDDPVVETPKAPSPDDEDSDVEKVLVAYTGQNPRWDVIGFTFIKQHPFHSIPLAKAEWLIKNQPDRFRLAMPSEVTDYYN